MKNLPDNTVKIPKILNSITKNDDRYKYLMYIDINSNDEFNFEDYKNTNQRHLIINNLDEVLFIIKKFLKTAIDTFEYKEGSRIDWFLSDLKNVYNDFMDNKINKETINADFKLFNEFRIEKQYLFDQSIYFKIIIFKCAVVEIRD